MANFRFRNEEMDLVNLSVLAFPMPYCQLSLSLNNLLCFGPTPLTEEGLDEIIDDYDHFLAQTVARVLSRIHGRAMIVDAARHRKHY